MNPSQLKVDLEGCKMPYSQTTVQKAAPFHYTGKQTWRSKGTEKQTWRSKGTGKQTQRTKGVGKQTWKSKGTGKQTQRSNGTGKQTQRSKGSGDPILAKTSIIYVINLIIY